MNASLGTGSKDNSMGAYTVVRRVGACGHCTKIRIGAIPFPAESLRAVQSATMRLTSPGVKRPLVIRPFDLHEHQCYNPLVHPQNARPERKSLDSVTPATHPIYMPRAAVFCRANPVGSSSLLTTIPTSARYEKRQMHENTTLLGKPGGRKVLAGGTLGELDRGLEGLVVADVLEADRVGHVVCPEQGQESGHVGRWNAVQLGNHVPDA